MSRKNEHSCNPPKALITNAASSSWNVVEQRREEVPLPGWARSGRGYGRLVQMAVDEGTDVRGLLNNMALQKEYATLHAVPFDRRSLKDIERLDKLDRLIFVRE